LAKFSKKGPDRRKKNHAHHVRESAARRGPSWLTETKTPPTPKQGMTSPPRLGTGARGGKNEKKQISKPVIHGSLGTNLQAPGFQPAVEKSGDYSVRKSDKQGVAKGEGRSNMQSKRPSCPPAGHQGGKRGGPSDPNGNEPEGRQVEQWGGFTKRQKSSAAPGTKPRGEKRLASNHFRGRKTSKKKREADEERPGTP